MRIAWITGGGTGIGRALAEALFRQGHRVAISGRRPDVLEAAAREIRQAANGAGEIAAVPCDVSVPSAIETAVSAIEKRWGSVDLLINNAGVNSYQALSSAGLSDFETLFRINCLGAVAAVERVLPEMKRRRGGAIVNIASVLGLFASSDSAAYSVSKFAVHGYTEVLQQGLQGTGIHVMGVYPGFIKTAMTQPFVKPGSLKEKLGAEPAAMAAAILRGLACRRRAVYFPWYVPWLVRLHRWFPALSDRLAVRARRRNETQ